MPRYFTILGSHFVHLALIFAPKHLPADLTIIYTTPITTTAISVNTDKSSSAPLITKKRISMGAVQRSALSISSSEKSQILQNTVPSIIQARSEENPICIPKISNLISESPTVSITNVTDIAILFDREWKNFSQCVKRIPITNPRTKERTTSRSGSRIIDAMLTVEEVSDLAIPNEIAKTTRPTASSSATTGKRMSVPTFRHSLQAQWQLARAWQEEWL